MGTMDKTQLIENLASVRARIAQACIASNRQSDSVKLMAVSKTKPVEMIRTLIEAGQTHFGENYLQEAEAKIAGIKSQAVKWHFIGAIQSKKCTAIARDFDYVHGIDRDKILIKLDAAAEAANKTLYGFIQVNIDGETNKAGCLPEEVSHLLKSACQLENLQIVGLMCIPQADKDPGQAFQKMSELLKNVNANSQYKTELTELSMGMTSDFKQAIMYGSTFVRVGTALFGKRE